MKKEERLAMIRRIGHKIDLEKKGKFALAAALNTRVRKYVDTDETKLESLADAVDESRNINAWTDAEVFAKAVAGETYEATTRFDNEWN